MLLVALSTTPAVAASSVSTIAVSAINQAVPSGASAEAPALMIKAEVLRKRLINCFADNSDVVIGLFSSKRPLTNALEMAKLKTYSRSVESKLFGDEPRNFAACDQIASVLAVLHCWKSK